MRPTISGCCSLSSVFFFIVYFFVFFFFKELKKMQSTSQSGNKRDQSMELNIINKYSNSYGSMDGSVLYEYGCAYNVHACDAGERNMFAFYC